MNGKNFKKFLKINDLTQENAGKILNVTRQTVNIWCKMEEIPAEILQKVKLHFPNFDIMESDMQSKNYQNLTIENNNSDICMSNASKSINNKGIPLIPIDAMAGIGKGESQIMEYECERYVVPIFKGAEFLIQVKGSSMIPKYNSGDIVACKRLPLNDLFFQWNKVYVLDTNQGALVKRIKKGSDNDHILIVSDNEQYEPFELHKNQVNGVALVIGVIRLE